MHLIKGNTQNKHDTAQESLYIHRIRQIRTILSPDKIEIGGYYLFKENFGMVALVKVIKVTSSNGWVSFRLKIKRTLYSPWDIPAGKVFETGYCPEENTQPTSWHFEPSMSLIKTNKMPSSQPDGVSICVESAL